MREWGRGKIRKGESTQEKEEMGREREREHESE